MTSTKPSTTIRIDPPLMTETNRLVKAIADRDGIRPNFTAYLQRALIKLNAEVRAELGEKPARRAAKS